MTTGARHILIVEDEPGLAMGLEENLTLEGFRVETVGNGDTAIQIAREQVFALILLDVMLPGKDGFQVCRELRKSGVVTPIILLTARTLDVEKVLGLKLGADDYVTKPFNAMELLARIEAVLRRASPDVAPEIVEFGDIRVDFGRCEVLRNGVPVALTAVEFKLLSAFVRSKGRVLSRQHLLDQVWAGTNCGDRVVDTHVANLRRKIEPDASAPRHVVSLRSLGYRFDA